MTPGTSAPTVIALRALGLGDFLTGLPALRVIRAALPGWRVILACPEVFRPVLELAGTADALLPSEELRPLSHPGGDLRLAVDLHGNGPASLALLEALRPTRIIAFAGPGDQPAWRADEHEVDRWIRLARDGLAAQGLAAQGLGAQGLGAQPDAGGVAGSVRVPAIPGASGVTIIHPGAAAPSRRWPPDRFAAVARSLVAQGHRVVITGGAREAGLAESIAHASGATATVGLSLVELFALVARARLVVSGDTGVAHIASNYRTPSVVLFGPVSPAVWGPPVDPRHRVIWLGDGDGDPHGDEVDPALLRISVDRVREEIDVLEETLVLEEARASGVLRTATGLDRPVDLTGSPSREMAT